MRQRGRTFGVVVLSIRRKRLLVKLILFLRLGIALVAAKVATSFLMFVNLTMSILLTPSAFWLAVQISNLLSRPKPRRLTVSKLD